MKLKQVMILCLGLIVMNRDDMLQDVSASALSETVKMTQSTVKKKMKARAASAYYNRRNKMCVKISF